MTDREQLEQLVASLSDTQTAAFLKILRRLVTDADNTCAVSVDTAFEDWLLPEEDEAWRHLQRVP